MQDQINLMVTREEASALVSVLGDLPTKTNAFPLMQKLMAQIQMQQGTGPKPATRPEDVPEDIAGDGVDLDMGSD